MNAHTKKVAQVTMTSREFNQHTGRAKSAADHGPVIITDRGKPAYVLTSYAEHQAAHPTPKPVKLSALEALADPNYDPENDFDIMDYIPKREVEPPRFSFDEDE